MSFVLEELEKILNLSISGRVTSPKTDNLKKTASSTLPDIERLDVDQLDLLSVKLNYLPVDLRRKINTNRAGLISGCTGVPASNLKSLQYPTIDDLFASMMRSFVLTRLAQLIERPYPAARLMICDRKSYDYLVKMQYVSINRCRTMGNSSPQTCSRYSIYQNPFNVTAVFLLRDIVNQINRAQKPFVTLKRDSSSSKLMANFDYSLIKQTFPYLRITDLIYVLADISDLKLYSFNVSGHKEHQVLQYLSHFARSTSLIEVAPIVRQTGTLHPIYNNVSIFKPVAQPQVINSHLGQEQLTKKGNKLESYNTKLLENVHFKLPLVHLSYLAYRLIQLAQSLHIQLKSISFRAGDPFNFTKLFAQIVATGLQSSSSAQAVDARQQARVLVLDRFADLQTILQHTELYGPFLEQELQLNYNSFKMEQATNGKPKESHDQLSAKMIRNKLDHGIHSVNELDTELHLERITNVFSSIVKFTMELKPKTEPQVSRSNPNGPLQWEAHEKVTPASLSSIITTNQAIQKHLEMVKLMYKQLDSGYLLMLKLESKAMDLLGEIRNIKVVDRESLEKQQVELLEKLKRIVAAYKQLGKLSIDHTGGGSSSPAIKALDLLRLACILIDLINTFDYIYSAAGPDYSTVDGAGQPAGQASSWRQRLTLRGSERRSVSTSDRRQSQRSMQALNEMRSTLLNGKELIRSQSNLILNNELMGGKRRGEAKNGCFSPSLCCDSRGGFCGTLEFCCPQMPISNDKDEPLINGKWQEPSSHVGEDGEDEEFQEGNNHDNKQSRDHLYFLDKLHKFDKLSRSTCGSRSAWSLFEMIEHFYMEKLDESSFPTLNLACHQAQKKGFTPPKQSGNLPPVYIVLFLSSLSYDELARLKVLESTLKKKKKSGASGGGGGGSSSGDILLLASSVVRPQDFLKSL